MSTKTFNTTEENVAFLQNIRCQEYRFIIKYALENTTTSNSYSSHCGTYFRRLGRLWILMVKCYIYVLYHMVLDMPHLVKEFIYSFTSIKGFLQILFKK